MTIVLLGYMGSGKTTIGKYLADKIGYDFHDLDLLIEEEEQTTVAEIFAKKGNIYFRKAEALMLRKNLKRKGNLILALGGGTPCYAGNMDYINSTNDSVSIYLKGSIPFLTDRLFKDKTSRPLISKIQNKDELMEFIGKHLFERSRIYQQADFTINIDNKTPDEIIQDILQQLF